MIFSKRVGHAQLAILTQQLSVLIECGVPLVESLHHLVQEETHPFLRSTLTSVVREVESGSSLAQALAKHPGVFNEMVVGMVRAGEAGGTLDIILKRLASLSARTARTGQTVRTMLIYPTAVVCVSCVVVGAILVWIVPAFRDLFATLDTPLPVVTRLVLESERLLVQFLPAILCTSCLSGLALTQLVSDKRTKDACDKLVLRLPLLGQALATALLGRLAVTLGTLLESGLPVLEALDITGRAAGNRTVRRTLRQVEDAVANGHSLSTAFNHFPFFPGTFARLVAAGERSGELARTLLSAGDYYEDRSSAATSRLVALIEPVMILGLGLTVGGIVVSMYLPIFDLISRLSSHY